MEWLNQVDATYRTDLRELNELNFARFDAKLEQRVAQLDAKVEQRTAELMAKMAELKSDLIKWMFAFWAPTALAVISLLLRR